MESITVTLFLLLAVVVSGWLQRGLPWSVPLPIVQIALGALIALVAKAPVELNPDVFFLLFLPPLLFLDGWRIPKEGLFRDKDTILELAVGLVIFTVVGLGFLINWMIPAMPLPVAFALAAVVSPTDPVAVSALSSRAPIPKRLLHILEGESLLNDASGLVCMRFAVAAAMTGLFSPLSAIGTFLWLSLGGIVIGVVVTWVITRLKDWLSWRLGEDSGSQILISLLIPFGAYLMAEHLHCSGILAAVAAGITMSYAELRGRALATTRVRRSGVWDTIQFSVNGVIFVLLGEQMPKLIEGATRVVQDAGHHDPLWLIGYVIAINAALAALRFVWVWVSLRLTLYRASRAGHSTPARRPSLRLVAATSLAGVRGAITLAGVLTLPLFLPDGSPFPARDLAIFLAAGVILTSLVAATIGLPFVLGGLQIPAEPAHDEQEDAARIAAAEAAIKAIEHAQHELSKNRPDADLYADTGAKIMDVYRARMTSQPRSVEEAEKMRLIGEIERQLRLAGLRAERDELYRLVRGRQLSEELVRKLVREIDLHEARLTAS
ncbi:Na+/H+ antiporter [Steroidobacter cummioxidans]|uniref:Na+/H+ antiporter n=1 Tax=Steroidobacter cummioxidans TaxID=1803913 RepID=UPI000E319827|nr:Na+/H+ antiporter [Steroidobacter cummioxidans]